MQARKLTPQPGSRIVLVRDRIDAKLRDESIRLRRRTCAADVQQRLRKGVGAAPRQHPQRTTVGAIGCAWGLEFRAPNGFCTRVAFDSLVTPPASPLHDIQISDMHLSDNGAA